ncbi:MAG TPA: phenylalanine 4-monooxygenase [Pyrinomonadaceae bacterium]|nr:phenylalanine 4-monooxygenase [Pyrinomonadaceae bacterium]
MTVIQETAKALLSDHVDMRPVTAGPETLSLDRNALVKLDPDHPGFRDLAYRARRNQIARIAADYRSGEPVPAAPYTQEENELWRTVLETIAPFHASYACAEYLEGFCRLDLPRERIPQLSEVSVRVEDISGFRLEPVAGLVEPRVFLESLADGVFLCTQYIRHHSTPHYTPEPDVVHEILGHAVTLGSERLSELNRMVGRAVKRTKSAEALEKLSRIYWFTLEFGVVREGGKIKAYGTGLLSSSGELEAMSRAELRPFDLEAASGQEYDPTDYQPVLFCADSFDQMYFGLKEHLQSFV